MMARMLFVAVAAVVASARRPGGTRLGRHASAAARGAVQERLFAAPRWLSVARGGSSATKRKKKKSKKKVVVEEEPEDEEEEAALEEEAPGPARAAAPVLDDRDFKMGGGSYAVDGDLDDSSVVLAPALMEDLGVEEGDVVRVHGARRASTVARVTAGEGGSGADVVASPRVAEAAALLGPSCGVHGVQLAVAGTVGVAPERSSLPEALEDVAEESDALFDDCLAPYFAGADRPVVVGQTFVAALDLEDGDVVDVTFKITTLGLDHEGAPLREAIVGAESSLVPEAPYDEDLETAKIPSYGDVGGCAAHIDQLKEVLEMPLHSPRLFSSIGVNPPRGVLLHGPPGCGKTTLMRAAAYECGCNVEVLNGGDVAAKKPGEAEELLRAKFAAAEKGARPPSPLFYVQNRESFVADDPPRRRTSLWPAKFNL